MATISTKGIYGLTAIVIISKENSRQLLQVKDIAAKGNIPQNYLEQILAILKKNKIVESIRGAKGGYRLAKDSQSITVYDVLNSLECCMEYTNNINNILEPFWKDTHQKIKEIFSLPIADLEKFLEINSLNIMYHI